VLPVDGPGPRAATRRGSLGAPRQVSLLSTALDWTTNVGYPGYATAAIDEVFNTFILPTMFARAARDEATPEGALRAAQSESARIFTKWS